MGDKFPKLTDDVKAALINGGFKIEKEHPLYADKQKSPRADILIGKDSDRWVVVEIEEGQCHPDTNILKYWEFLEKSKNINLKLIHILGRGFLKEKHKSRVDNCRFLKNKMERELGERFQYILEDLKDYGFKTLEDYRLRHEEIKNKVIEIILENSKL